MAIFITHWDSATGKRKFIPYPGFIDEAEIVSGSEKSNFVIAGTTITSNHKIDSWVDGRLQVDGEHFTKNVGSNRIEFVSPVPVGKRVDIRIYLK